MNKRQKAKHEIDCLGLGIIPFDLLFTVDQFPGKGMKIDGRDFVMQGGGPVPNVATGLARLGCQAALIASVGDDPFGNILLSELKTDGVDTRYMVIKKKKPTALAAGLIENGSGRRTMILARDITVKPSDLTLSKYPIPRIVHLDGRDLDACLKLARWGKKVGALVSFDIGSVRNDVSALLPLVDHLVVADAWAFPFTGTRSGKAAIKKLTSHCPGTIVVTEGIKGSLGLEDGEFVHQAAFKVNNVDTTGAGDAFHSGYLYGWLQGMTLSERMRFGSATAAIKCTRPGARCGIATLREVKLFLKNDPKKYA